MSDHAPSPGCCLEHDLEFREYQVTKLRAQVASLTAQRDALRDALAQADKWILNRDLARDGACAECWPGSEIPPAFAGFRCAWHHARAREVLLSLERGRGAAPAPPEETTHREEGEKSRIDDALRAALTGLEAAIDKLPDSKPPSAIRLHVPSCRYLHTNGKEPCTCAALALPVEPVASAEEETDAG